jgi:Na+/glutamate symporter
MIAIVRTTAWALVGGLWGAALATRDSTEAGGRAALLGAAIGLVAGAFVGRVMHAWLRRIRIRRRRRRPDS